MTGLDIARKPRTPGLCQGPDGRFMRRVDRVVVAARPLDFRSLICHVIRPDTRYLVLDLDGTFHKGLNLGVLLGWEISALQAYGLDFLLRAEERRGRGKVVWNRRDARARLRYVSRGLTRWAGPGTLYYALARAGWKHDTVRHALGRRLGPFAMDRMLSIMRLNLMHHMPQVPLHEIRELSASLWRRYAGLQVIEPGDIAWLRERFPNLVIAVSSASPDVCLDVVREKFPVHEVYSTEIEVRNGRTSTPHLLHPLFGRGRPERIAPPRTLRPNAGHLKISRLLEAHPDFQDPDVHTVGITDTKHGEDHAFAEYFKCVADINSPDPFFPLVSAASPLADIYSARLLTRDEKQAGQASDGNALRRLAGDELEGILCSDLDRAERGAAQTYSEYRAARRGLEQMESLLAELEEIAARNVDAYNQAAGPVRSRALENLRNTMDRTYQAQNLRAEICRPMMPGLFHVEEACVAARQSVRRAAGREAGS
ncbi:MAG: hypothetical protein AB1921_09210 [Thermodesulfobacteriota bacterium]